MKNVNNLLLYGLLAWVIFRRPSGAGIFGQYKSGVDKIYQEAIKIFEKYGYIVSRGANSKTDYGHSRYFYIRTDNFFYNDHLGLGLKVRVSDHSATDAYRIRTELMISDNKPSLLTRFHEINYFVNPNHYKIDILNTEILRGKTVYTLKITFLPENYIIYEGKNLFQKPQEITPNADFNKFNT